MHLQPALVFHRRVTDNAGAHLAHLCGNTLNTPWLATKLLSKDPLVAQAGAQGLARHLAATNPSNKTLFEQTLFEQTHLWENLIEFSIADPPVLLWHGHGRHQGLFEFLAARFLLNPDHVLDADLSLPMWFVSPT